MSYRFGIFILALTCVAYLPAVRGGFVWDDNDYVTDNMNLRSVQGLGNIWADPHSDWQYYPLVFTTFWAEYQAWGLSPAGYHVDNILLQALGAFLLWRLLLKLGFPSGAAWLGAAIFAVHPVQVESVAWVTERKNVLSGVFYLGAMNVWFGGRGKIGLMKKGNPHPSTPPEYRERGKNGGIGRYFLALGLFVCAMLSKTTAVTWPAAVWVIEWWKSGAALNEGRPSPYPSPRVPGEGNRGEAAKFDRREVLRLGPFFLIGLVLAWVTAGLEHDQVGAVGREWDLSFSDRFIIAGRALWFYAGKILWPSPLSFVYPKWDLQAERLLQGLMAVSAAGFILALVLLRRKIGRGPAAAALLFAGTLVPALGFVNVYPMRYTYVADHYQYLAMAAIAVPLAVVFWRWVGAWAVVILGPLVMMTWMQCGVYRDSQTLWTDTVSKNQMSWMAHVNLGQVFQMQKRLAEAEKEFAVATEVQPDESETWRKLGDVQAQQKRYVEAEANFRHALEIDPANPVARDELQEVIARRGR